jgi:hypothetical protein
LKKNVEKNISVERTYRMPRKLSKIGYGESKYPKLKKK